MRVDPHLYIYNWVCLACVSVLFVLVCVSICVCVCVCVSKARPRSTSCRTTGCSGCSCSTMTPSHTSWTPWGSIPTCTATTGYVCERLFACACVCVCRLHQTRCCGGETLAKRRVAQNARVPASHRCERGHHALLLISHSSPHSPSHNLGSAVPEPVCALCTSGRGRRALGSLPARERPVPRVLHVTGPAHQLPVVAFSAMEPQGR